MSPSPGAYDAAQSETLSARSGKSFNTSASMGKASFGTFSKRDKKLGASEGGDPGAYTVENPGVNSGKAETIESRSRRSFNRDVSAGKGSFSSNSQRSGKAAASSQKGGPGEYDCSHLYSCGSSAQITSSFMSSTPLGGHVRKSETPGAGEYSPQQVEGGSARKGGGTSAFAGSTQSRGASGFSATGANVGPGSYEVEQSSLYQQMLTKTNSRLPAFGSSSVRQGPEA